MHMLTFNEFPKYNMFEEISVLKAKYISSNQNENSEHLKCELKWVEVIENIFLKNLALK